MGDSTPTRGALVVLFRQRYYNALFDDYKCRSPELSHVIASIPADAEGYQQWLESARARYAAKEHTLETYVPKPFMFEGNVYIIDLDREVFTINWAIHWKLDNIPRQEDTWIRAISKPTISPDICPKEHVASPALKLPEPKPAAKFNSLLVYPKTEIAETRKVFITWVLAKTLVVYNKRIVMVGKDWSPDSFPFRELVFALVSVASGQAGFYSASFQGCGKFHCMASSCRSRLSTLSGWLDQCSHSRNKALLLEFGSMSNLPGNPPGVSPAGTMYWLEGVLISLVLVIDGEALEKAITWGIEQGRVNFQIIILTLFKVSFAEVSTGDDDEPIVKVSDAIPLKKSRLYEEDLQKNSLRTRRILRSGFPGFAALVSFFETAANRRAASSSRGVFPLEIYHRILDFVDYDTWKNCLVLSTGIRYYCLREYRLDDRTSIVAGPYVYEKMFIGDSSRYPYFSFDFNDRETGETFPMEEAQSRFVNENSWVPVIGSDRKAAMLMVKLSFHPKKVTVREFNE